MASAIVIVSRAKQSRRGRRRLLHFVRSHVWYDKPFQPHAHTLGPVATLPAVWRPAFCPGLHADVVAKRALHKGYTWFDMSLTSADNPYTPTLAERAGAKLYKRYRVYRLVF